MSECGYDRSAIATYISKQNNPTPAPYTALMQSDTHTPYRDSCRSPQQIAVDFAIAEVHDKKHTEGNPCFSHDYGAMVPIALLSLY